MDVGLLYLIDAVKGKKISIFLQIGTVYISQLTNVSALGVTQSIHAKICIGVHRGGVSDFKFPEYL